MNLSQRLLSFACALTLQRYDLASRSNAMDRAYIFRDAILLTIMFVWQWFAWSFVASIVIDHQLYAVTIALLVASVLIMLDLAIGGTCFENSGFLSEESNAAGKFKKIIPRVIITLPSSAVTSIAVILVLFEGAIAEKLQLDRAIANQPVINEYRQRIDELESQILQPHKQSVRLSHGAVQEARDHVTQEIENLSSIRARRDQLALEASCELSGSRPGCTKDRYIPQEGPAYHELVRQVAVEDERINRAEERINLLRSEEQRRLASLAKAQEERDAALTAFKEEEAKLINAQELDPRWIPERDDLLIRFQSLLKLIKDSEDGVGILLLSMLAWSVLMAIELSYVLVKLIYAPASCYTIRARHAAEVEARGIPAEFYPPDHDFISRLRVVVPGNDREAV